MPHRNEELQKLKSTLCDEQKHSMNYIENEEPPVG